jgi:hypothetical protein
VGGRGDDSGSAARPQRRAAIGLALVIVPVFLYDSETPFPAGMRRRR